LLIAAHEIVYLPSASVLALLRREAAARTPAPKTLAVLADPVFSDQDERVSRLSAEGQRDARQSMNQRALVRAWEDVSGSDASTRLERLSGSAQEADAITARVPAAQQLKALGFAANRATATDPVLSQYRILHFATHAVINNVHPELSGLVLSLVDEQGRAQDGFLRAHEIFNLKLPAELAVLSACRTALGKEVKGEGVISLARGFMYAGAPRVVVSLWAVRDVETTNLMAQFYRQLLGTQRRSPAAALRAAQAEMWRKGLPPYYWAAFVLQGEWK
jgi:CHAT domain-containing protein